MSIVHISTRSEQNFQQEYDTERHNEQDYDNDSHKIYQV